VRACNTGYHLCGTTATGTCAPDDNATGANCGPSCTQCPGNQVCIDNACSPPQP
jgi:hypothetical protein